MPVYLRKSFDQWKLTLIFSPYKLELSMIRSCPDRLEFKNECYSTVTQSISKNNDICINFMGRSKTKPFLKQKKMWKLYFHFWPPKKCPPFFFLTHTWWCENITASPCESSPISSVHPNSSCIKLRHLWVFLVYACVRPVSAHLSSWLVCRRQFWPLTVI